MLSQLTTTVLELKISFTFHEFLMIPNLIFMKGNLGYNAKSTFLLSLISHQINFFYWNLRQTIPARPHNILARFRNHFSSLRLVRANLRKFCKICIVPGFIKIKAQKICGVAKQLKYWYADHVVRDLKFKLSNIITIIIGLTCREEG